MKQLLDVQMPVLCSPDDNDFDCHDWQKKIEGRLMHGGFVKASPKQASHCVKFTSSEWARVLYGVYLEHLS
jgi:hypothetical protein